MIESLLEIRFVSKRGRGAAQVVIALAWQERP
jgi:hypothetical protein